MPTFFIIIFDPGIIIAATILNAAEEISPGIEIILLFKLFPPVEINKEKYIDGCCKNIYGSHPNDKYILGYCIIGQEDSVEYFNSVILSMINSKKPRGTFIITCKKLSSIANYTDVSTINKLEFLNYYCRGIEFAKDQLT